MTIRQKTLIILCGILLLALTMIAGICIGETSISPKIVYQTLSNKILGTTFPVSDIQSGIVWNYRLTRVIVASCCGACLAVCGIVLQSLLRNALAEPYLLGVSAGASTGAVMVLILGVGANVVSLSMGAFIGAIIAVCLVSLLAFISDHRSGINNSETIILAGVFGAQFFSALTYFIVSHSASSEAARGILFWLLGNMSRVRWPDVYLAFPVAIIGVSICMWFARALDAFTFGIDSAASLGISVRPVRIFLFLITSLMTATMVSIVGAIGFVGLVIPHAARFIVGVRHKRLLPTSVFMGAIFLVLADIISRIILPNQIMPIGVITALIGAPSFALIMMRGIRAK